MLKVQGYRTACIRRWHLGFQESRPPLQESGSERRLFKDGDYQHCPVRRFTRSLRGVRSDIVVIVFDDEVDESGKHIFDETNTGG
jgi:hypothetical protein